MGIITEYILLGFGLMLAVLGFADIISCLVRSIFALPENLPADNTLTLRLKNADTAEQQLRDMLSKIKLGTYRGRVNVMAEDEECFLIADKILRKYPNIGLFYREDLNYNI